MLMILARLVRSESFWAVVKVRSPHTGPEVCYIIARLAGAPHESVQTCHTPLASEVGRRPWRDPQEMPHHPRTYTPPMRR